MNPPAPAADVRLGPMRLAVATLAWLIGAAYFFSAPVFSGFRLMSGDLGDWRLGVFLAEHWRMILEGTAPWSWRQPPYFTPLADSIAFTDPSFGLAFPHVFLRWAGVDAYLSFQITVMAYSYAGFLGFVALALRVGRASFGLALFGALGFVFSNMNLVKLEHPIYAPVSLLAVVALLYAGALAALPRRPGRAQALGLLGAALFGFLAFTCFQVAWYGGLVALATMIVLALALRPPLRAAMGQLDRGRIARFALVQAAALAVALLPLLAAFASTWAAGRDRPYWEMLHFSPRPIDLVNLGGGNLLWGPIAVLTGRVRGAWHNDIERSLAHTPIAAAAFLLLLAWLWRDRRRHVGDFRLAAIVAAGIAVIVLTPLPIAIGNVSGWWVLRHVIPGATAIRTPFRLQLALALPLWLLLATGATMLRHELAAALARRAPALRATLGAGLGLIGALILLEQINLSRVRSLNRPVENAWLAAIPPAPAQCRSFFVASQASRPSVFTVQTDAMMVAMRERLPTANGNSGSPPWHWRLHEVHDPDYLDNVAQWAQRYELAGGLCRLDLPAGTWSLWSPP